MPIDPNIALQVGQPVKPIDPMAAYGQVLTLKNLMDQQRMQGLQLEKAQRDEADARGLRRAYAVTPDGQIDEQATTRNLVAGGFGPQAVDFRHKTQVDRAAAAKAEREAEKSKYEMLAKQTEIIGQELGALPEVPTYEQAVTVSRRLNARGVQHDEREIPQDPMELAEYVRQRRMATMSAQQQLAELAPKSRLGELLRDQQRERERTTALSQSSVSGEPSIGPDGSIVAPTVNIQAPPDPYAAAVARETYGPADAPFQYGPDGKVRPNLPVQEYGLKKAKAGAINVNNYPPNALEPGKATRTDLEKSLIGSAASISRLNDIEAGFRPEYLQAAPRFSAAWSAIKEKGGANLSPGDRRFLENFSTWSRSAIEEVNSYIQEKTGAAMGVQEAARLTKGIPNPGTGLFDGDSPSQFWSKLQGVLKQAKMVEARSLYALRNGLTLMGANGEPVIPLSAMPKIMDERGAALEVELRRQNPKISPKEMRTQVLRRLGEEFGISSD